MSRPAFPILTACQLVMVGALSATSPAAMFDVDPSHKFSWGENIGWMNWRDAGSPVGSQGVMFNPGILSGFVWCENVGYLNLGDATPSNGVAYSNVSGNDAGVNLLGDGRLAGLGWGENIGWVNFGPHATLPASQQARFDEAGARLRGYAWGENVGWINLDDATHFVGTSCAVDFNCDGFLDFFDYSDFVATFEGGSPPACQIDADFNGDGFVDFFDYDDFVSGFEQGC